MEKAPSIDAFLAELPGEPDARQAAVAPAVRRYLAEVRKHLAALHRRSRLRPGGERGQFGSHGPADPAALRSGRGPASRAGRRARGRPLRDRGRRLRAAGDVDPLGRRSARPVPRDADALRRLHRRAAPVLDVGCGAPHRLRDAHDRGDGRARARGRDRPDGGPDGALPVRRRRVLPRLRRPDPRRAAPRPAGLRPRAAGADALARSRSTATRSSCSSRTSRRGQGDSATTTRPTGSRAEPSPPCATSTICCISGC